MRLGGNGAQLNERVKWRARVNRGRRRGRRGERILRGDVNHADRNEIKELYKISHSHGHRTEIPAHRLSPEALFGYFPSVLTGPRPFVLATVTIQTSSGPVALIPSLPPPRPWLRLEPANSRQQKYHHLSYLHHSFTSPSVQSSQSCPPQLGAFLLASSHPHPPHLNSALFASSPSKGAKSGVKSPDSKGKAKGKAVEKPKEEEEEDDSEDGDEDMEEVCQTPHHPSLSFNSCLGQRRRRRRRRRRGG